MSSTIKTMILAAVVLAAAVGCVLVFEESDAEGTYSVSYVVGEGDDARTYVYQADADGKVTLSTIEDLGAVLPEGKAFAGWSDGTTTYTAGSVLTLTEDTTLTALTTDIQYTVSFVVDGRTVDTVTGIHGGEVTTPEAPVKDGYIFEGWDSGYGTVLTEIPAISGNVTYTAVFAEDFEITFVVDGTTITATNISDLQVPSDPSKTGAEFRGWALPDGTVIDPETYTFTADTTLTASWRADTLTVTFTAGGQTIGSVLVEYGQSVPANSVPALPTGYDSWDTDVTAPITEDTVFEAQLIELTVTFVVGEETKEVTVTYGSAVSAEDVPVLDADVYSGWDRDLTAPITEDVTITAQEVVVPEEQSWIDDTGNQLIVLFAAVIIIAVLGYCAWMIKEGTFPFTISRKGKE